jgi:hypothetical protein
MATAELELRERDKFDHIITSRDRDADFAALLSIWRRVAARVSATWA